MTESTEMKQSKRFAGYFALLAVLGLLVMACDSQPVKERYPKIDNPLVAEFNAAIDFATVTATDIDSVASYIKAKTDFEIEQVINLQSTRTFENTMVQLDATFSDMGTIFSSLYLIMSTHPDSTVRQHASDAVTDLGKFNNELQLNEELYQAIKSYSQSAEVARLSRERTRNVERMLSGFERNGFALDSANRVVLKGIRDRITELGNQFNQNIAAYSDHSMLTEREVRGLPDDWKESRRQEDGRYKVDLSYPSYIPFMKYAQSDEGRKELYIKFKNRAADQNLTVLVDMLRARQEMASLLGYNTYAEYRVGDRMAATTANVWEFETELSSLVRAKADLDYAELLDVKSKVSGQEASEVYAWQASYYNNINLVENYEVDEAEVKQYFELNQVLEGLFSITQNLFGLEYREVAEAAVWHEDVRLFEVYKGEELMGRFYLDLHPRDNKYNHAACFPIVTGRQTEQGYQIPQASLVCNFPAPGEDGPALMPHGQVETFFHEFGHVLHHILSRAEMGGEASFSVARDFVEAPSQIFENWTWDYASLSLFAKHHETGEVLPEALFEKMVAAKNVGSGMGALQQIYYGTLDFTLHDRFDPDGEETTTDVARRLQNEITLYPFVEGTAFEASFGHLNGYGAGYYGYLWSNVYAQDMFSEFEKNGILDEETGRRYRDIILAQGATKPELELVREFLGREPNQKAFLRSLGLEDRVIERL